MYSGKITLFEEQSSQIMVQMKSSCFSFCEEEEKNWDDYHSRLIKMVNDINMNCMYLSFSQLIWDQPHLHRPQADMSCWRRHGHRVGGIRHQRQVKGHRGHRKSSIYFHGCGRYRHQTLEREKARERYERKLFLLCELNFALWELGLVIIWSDQL